MSKRMPPVPSAGRSDKGQGSAPHTAEVKQNTTNTGYQQDR